MRVVVASQNPAKLKAVEMAFEELFKHTRIIITTCEAESGVSHQPINNNETYEGALNRANNALSQISDADYWVGIEGGVEKRGDDYECFAWIVVRSVDKISRGKTGTFVLPKAVSVLIDQGKELGEADDVVFGLKDSKKSIGAVGILTKGNVTRSSYYTEAVKLALIPFLNKELY